MENIRIIRRPFDKEQDQALLYSTWQLGLWGGMARATDRPTPQFFSIHSRSIAKILDMPDTRVEIACTSDNPGLIVGYAVLNKKHLHWIYVKEDYRKHGIGTLLASGFETIAKPMTKIARALAEKKELKVLE